MIMGKRVHVWSGRVGRVVCNVAGPFPVRRKGPAGAGGAPLCRSVTAPTACRALAVLRRSAIVPIHLLCLSDVLVHMARLL